jgi:hypothetical protein
MKKEIRTVFKCEYCGKHYFFAASCVYHEKVCRSKPANKHICFDYCKHLNLSYEWKPCSSDPEDGGTNVSKFECLKTGQQMYSYKLEARAPQHIKPDMVRMPLDCNQFEAMTDHEIFDSVND